MHQKGPPQFKKRSEIPGEEFSSLELGHLSPMLLTELTRRLPKIDLHNHFEGALRPEQIVHVAKRHNVALPTYDVEQLRPHVQVMGTDSSLVEFLKKFDLLCSLFQTPRIAEELAYEVVSDNALDNVVYLELRFSPYYMAEARGLDHAELTDAVIQGVRRAQAEYDIDVNLIIIAERQRGIEVAWQMKELAEQFMPKGVVGLDLAHDEYNFPPGPYMQVFRAARAAGLHTTVHAGEAAGPENIRMAVEGLLAERIGHGVRAFEDPAVVELLREKQIPLELCPTSNVHTQAVANMQEHPFRRYFDAGLKVTINTDDPGVSGITLSDELSRIASTFPFTLDEFAHLQQNAIDVAFVNPLSAQDLSRRVASGFADAAEWLRERV